jgi:hypothetical protein
MRYIVWGKRSGCNDYKRLGSFVSRQYAEMFIDARESQMPHCDFIIELRKV